MTEMDLFGRHAVRGAARLRRKGQEQEQGRCQEQEREQDEQDQEEVHEQGQEDKRKTAEAEAGLGVHASGQPTRRSHCMRPPLERGVSLEARSQLSGLTCGLLCKVAVDPLRMRLVGKAQGMWQC